MSESKVSIRYIGCKTSVNGSRLLDFTCARSDGTIQSISVTVASELFRGPNGMAIQECPGICYETLKQYSLGSPEMLPVSVKLTSADVSQHRKHEKGSHHYRPKQSRRPLRSDSMK